MRITKQHRKLALRKGWNRGNKGLKKEIYPYEEIDLCWEYETGYYEGLDAKAEATNPYNGPSK